MPKAKFLFVALERAVDGESWADWRRDATTEERDVVCDRFA